MAIFNKSNVDSGISETTVISSGARIEGQFYFNSILHLDGEISGVVQAQSVGIIGKTGTLKGQLNAEKVVVNGRCEGELSADSLEILAGGLVNGNISTQSKQSLLALALIFGFAFGFIISRGQICFTACFRDLFLFGRENAIKGALIGMIIASLIAFAFILHGHNSKLIELSPAVAIGAFLFGFGIVFAGGCECGWTYRACEGQSHFMIVGAANIAGTMILALSYDFFPQGFKEGVKINLLDSFSNLGGLALNLLFLLSMLILALAYKKYFFKRIQK